MSGTQNLPYLKQLFEGKQIALDPTDGTRTIAQAKDVFGYIDSNFKNQEFDVPGEPTAAMVVSVNEQIKDGTFSQILGSVGYPEVISDMTQHQVVDFCTKHKNKLHQEGQGTFFPFQVRSKRFVAVVYVTDYNYDLRVFVHPCSGDDVLDAQFQRRFVFSELIN